MDKTYALGQHPSVATQLSSTSRLIQQHHTPRRKNCRKDEYINITSKQSICRLSLHTLPTFNSKILHETCQKTHFRRCTNWLERKQCIIPLEFRRNSRRKKKELESRVLGTLNTRFLSQNIAHNFLFIDEACIVFDRSKVVLNFNSKFLNCLSEISTHMTVLPTFILNIRCWI